MSHWMLVGMVASLMAGCKGRGDASVWEGNQKPGQAPGYTGKNPGYAPDGRKLEPFKPAPLQLRVLLSWQYRNAITDLLGAGAGAAVTPPPDTAVNGLDAIGAAQLALSPSSMAAYERSAQAAASELERAEVRDAVIGCDVAAEACLDAFLASFGHRAFRRPLAIDELAAWKGIAAEAAAAYGSTVKGVVFAVAGMLQSPHFLYLVEIGQADPTTPGWLRLTSRELAARLALFLIGSIPPEELLEAAEAGALDTPDGIRAQALALLARPEARRTTRTVFAELLGLRKLKGLPKDMNAFPEFDAQLAASMGEETLRLVDDLVWDRDADFRELFNADYTWVDASLARLYGLEAPPTATDFVRRELPAPLMRGGFLGHASFLSTNAHPLTTSPSFRGKFIRERLLCEPLASPPPGVDLSVAQTGGLSTTTRERMAEHATNDNCSGCHVLMDPIGFGLENFDALGRFRETENGHPVDGTGEFDEHGGFEGAAELGGLIATDPRVSACIARTLFRQATGHVDLPSEEAPLVGVDASFATQGYRLRALLAELAASDAFRFALPSSDSGSTP